MARIALIIVKRITLVGCKSRLTCLLKRRDLERQQITVLSYTKALVTPINYQSMLNH